MAHPSQFYIRYLLAVAHKTDEGESEESINTSLRNFSLPAMASDQFKEMVLTFSPPETFSFSNRSHPKTKKFMQDESIYTMWTSTKEDSRVIKELMPMAPIREMIHILLMGHVPHDKIAEIVNEKIGLAKPLSERMVNTYHHYYWNVDVASTTEWDAMLGGSKTKDSLMAALHCGPEQAMYRIGYNPKMGDPQRPIREAYRQTFFRLQALRYWPDTANTVATASKLIRDTKNLYELLYGQEGTGFEQQLKKFRQFLLVKHPNAVDTFDVMLESDGTHSGDGSSDKKKKPKEETKNADT